MTRKNLKMEESLHGKHKAKKNALDMTWNEYWAWSHKVTRDLDSDADPGDALPSDLELDFDATAVAAEVLAQLEASGVNLVDEDALADYVANRTKRDVLDGLKEFA